jgi:hypothetical protein
VIVVATGVQHPAPASQAEAGRWAKLAETLEEDGRFLGHSLHIRSYIKCSDIGVDL